MICEGKCVSATLPLISCTCRAVSQKCGRMVNNRDVAPLIRPLNRLFTILFLLFRRRHQFKPLWEYCQECQWVLGSNCPQWCVWRSKGLLDKGKSNPLYNKAQVQWRNVYACSEQCWYSFHLIQNNVKLDKQPKFTKLTYSDSGHYECKVTMGLLTRKASFDLVVEGEDSKETLFHSSLKLIQG